MYKARMSNVYIHFLSERQIIVNLPPLRIHQILTNLVSNAIDAHTDSSTTTISPTQTIEKIVTVKAEIYDNILRIQITDTGCGIQPQQLKVLFTDPQTTKPNGTGLGLTSIHSIITKELGGTIEVKSIIGVGTQFNVALPIKS